MAVNIFSIYGAYDYVQRATDPRYPKMIIQEHMSIINTPISGTCDNSQLPRNMKKNRYVELPCWDVSRVVLRSNPESDFINANYIAGFDRSKKFIATQEPMAATFDDFWNMVWQDDSHVIVMLNGTKKNSQLTNLQYFSSNKDNTILKEFVIKEEDIKLSPHYTTTQLNVTHKRTGEIREIHHFKYLNWLETGLPDPKIFLDFLLTVNKKDQQYFKKALELNQPLPGPIIVHGDAGIGRTAAFCAADICLYQLVHTANVSVPLIVLNVRQQRNFGIQFLNHYIFLNNVVLYFLVTIRSNFATFIEFRSHLNRKDVRLLLLQ